MTHETQTRTVLWVAISALAPLSFSWCAEVSTAAPSYEIHFKLCCRISLFAAHRPSLYRYRLGVY